MKLRIVDLKKKSVEIYCAYEMGFITSDEMNMQLITLHMAQVARYENPDPMTVNHQELGLIRIALDYLKKTPIVDALAKKVEYHIQNKTAPWKN